MIRPTFAEANIFNTAYNGFMRTQKRIQHLMGGGGSGKTKVAAQKIVLKYMLAPSSEKEWIQSQIIRYGDKGFTKMLKEGKLIIPNEWNDRMIYRYGETRYNELISSGELVQPVVYRDWREYIYLLRSQQNLVRSSQFAEIKDIIYEYKLQDKVESIQDSTLTIKFKNGNILKCAGLRGGGSGRLKSISGITGFWVEEATESGLDAASLDVLSNRLRLMKCKDPRIILTYNPIHESHWINRKFWLQKQQDSNEEITEQEKAAQSKTVFKLKTTYKDNRFLPQSWIDDLELTKYTNPDHYNVYALGAWGGNSKGCVYKYPEKDVREFPSIIDKFYYGVDIGFSHPFTIIKVGVLPEDVYREDKEVNEEGKTVTVKTLVAAKGIYLQEIVCEKGMLPSQILEKYKNVLPKDVTYYIDHRPDVKKEFEMAGYKAVYANKAVTEGITEMKKLPHYVVQNKENRSMNLLAEYMSYKYKFNKSLGIYTDEVEKEHDDCLDAARYAYYTGYVKKAGGSILDIVNVGGKRN